jgi:L-cysteine desulfidase
MAQALLTLQFLDSISSDIDAIMEFFRVNELVKTIDLVTIQFIDDAVRTEYGLDDTGLLIVWSYQHVEEAGAVIFRHIVTNE